MVYLVSILRLAQFPLPHTIRPGVHELYIPEVVSDNFGLYHPIALDANPVEVSNPGLNQWLNRGEAAMICMGSHFRCTKS